jgi:hypothetical protein
MSTARDNLLTREQFDARSDADFGDCYTDYAHYVRAAESLAAFRDWRADMEAANAGATKKKRGVK